jgi:hypothetical protein
MARSGRHSSYWCCCCQREVKVQLRYKLQVTVSIGFECVNVCLFQDHAAALIGCSPDKWSEIIQTNPDSIANVDDALAGQVIDIVVKSGKAKHVAEERAFDIEAKCSILNVSDSFVSVYQYMVQCHPSGFELSSRLQMQVQDTSNQMKRCLERAQNRDEDIYSRKRGRITVIEPLNEDSIETEEG